MRKNIFAQIWNKERRLKKKRVDKCYFFYIFRYNFLHTFLYTYLVLEFLHTKYTISFSTLSHGYHNYATRLNYQYCLNWSCAFIQALPFLSRMGSLFTPAYLAEYSQYSLLVAQLPFKKQCR